MFLSTRQEILELLQGGARGLVGLDEFQKRFEYLFLDREEWPVLDYRDKEFFGVVLEKVGWTAENPSAEERQLGWMDFESFRRWLEEALRSHLAGEHSNEATDNSDRTAPT